MICSFLKKGLISSCLFPQEEVSEEEEDVEEEEEEDRQGTEGRVKARHHRK